MQRDFPFTLIDAHFAYPDGIAAAIVARILGTHYSITLRGNEPMHASYPARREAIKWAIRNATQIIAVSSRLADFAVACGAMPERVRTIPNGVDTSIFYPRPKGGAFEYLKVPAGLPVILSAGYLIERKGHHHVMHALAGLRSMDSRAHLVIAGGSGAEGDYEGNLRNLAKKLQLQHIVHFAGAVPPETLASFMSEASVVCLASSREGWPNVVNESLACGTPVVATDIGGVPDMIPSADLGTIVSSGSPDALQSALRDAIARSWNRSQIASWGMSRSWEQVASEVQHTFRQAVNRGKSV
jgi:glycosyltransferase involved in cell wall biosynthesis